MTSWILMSRSSSVAADTASFRVKTKRETREINSGMYQCINTKAHSFAIADFYCYVKHREDISLQRQPPPPP